MCSQASGHNTFTKRRRHLSSLPNSVADSRIRKSCETGTTGRAGRSSNYRSLAAVADHGRHVGMIFQPAEQMF